MKHIILSQFRPAVLLFLGAVPIGAAPVAHWTFDADGADSSGNGYHSSLHGDATIAAGGRVGGALRLDGSGDFASTHNGTSSTYDGITGNNARSISLWIKAEGGASATNPNDIFLGWGGTSAIARNRYDLGLGNANDSRLRSELNAGFAETSASTTNLRDGNWHHVTLSYSAAANNVSFYVNGKLYQTVNYSANPVATTDVDLGVYIGTGVREGSNALQLQNAFTGNASRFWQGLIDDAGIWTSAVSATDVALLNGLGRIGNNDLSTLAPAAALWAGAANGTAVINGVTWQKVTGLTGAPGDWSQVGGNNGVGSFIVLDGAGGGIRITAAPNLLTWVGTAGGGTWDEGSSVHWKNASNTPATFQDFDAVRFDDTAASGSVSLAGDGLLPASIAFANETLPYTLTGGTWTGTGSLSKTGAADVILASDSGFSGIATLDAGTLRIGNGGSTGSLGHATITNNAALIIQRDGLLHFPAEILGTGTLDITGPGTVVLSGAATHTGATTIRGGTLRRAGSLISPVTVQSGGTLAPGPAARSGTLSLASLSLDAGSRTAFRVGFTRGDRISVTNPGGLAIQGAHAVDLVPTEPWLENDQFTLFTYDSSYTGSIANLSIGTAPHGSYSFFDDALSGEISVQVDALDTLVWKGNVSSAWDVDQTANWQLLSNNAAARFFAHDQVRFDGSAANTAVTLTGTVPAGEIVFHFNAPTQYQLSGPGSLTGFGDFEKSGTGTLILTNALTRNLTLLGGTVQVGDGGTSGSIGTGPILNDGLLVFQRSDDMTLAQAINGTGVLSQQGGGTLTLAGGADSYNAGDIRVNAGTLRLGAAESSLRLFPLSASRTITIHSGASMELLYRNAFGAIPSTPTTTLIVDGGTVLSSSGTAGSVNILQDPVLRNGANIRAVKNFPGFGAFQLQGTVTVAGNAASGISTSGGDVTVGNGADNTGITTFDVADVSGNSAADLTIEAIIRNSGNNGASIGGLTKSNAGTLLLTAANTYTGTTTVSEGTLAISGSLGNTAVTVESGATLAGSGGIGGPVTLQSGATHLLTVAASADAQITRIIGGTLTLEPGNILTLSATVAPASGTYTLATASGGIIGAPGTIHLPPEINGTVGISGNSIILTVGGAGDYDEWASSFPGFTDTAKNSDPDKDGLTNFQEYAFGLDPTRVSPVSPVAAPNKSAGTFTYSRRKQSLTGLTYRYQSSTTLAGWTTFTPVSEASNNGDPVETITVTLPAALLAEPKLFLRAEAAEP
jgi:autotransporter-associated beta strand protein